MNLLVTGSLFLPSSGSFPGTDKAREGELQAVFFFLFRENRVELAATASAASLQQSSSSSTQNNNIQNIRHSSYIRVSGFSLIFSFGHSSDRNHRKLRDSSSTTISVSLIPLVSWEKENLSIHSFIEGELMTLEKRRKVIKSVLICRWTTNEVEGHSEDMNEVICSRLLGPIV